MQAVCVISLYLCRRRRRRCRRPSIHHSHSHTHARARIRSSNRRHLHASAAALRAAKLPFDTVLVANRGEIALRVMRTAKRLGLRTVAVYSEADRNAMHVKMADDAVCIGPAPSSQSYLVIDNIMDAIKKTNAQVVHPGYGFLSENSLFSDRLAQAGVRFCGPSKQAMHDLGDKLESKKIAKNAGVHTVPGYLDEVHDEAQAITIANEIGYPVMVKASAGGGGKGMRIARNDEEVKEAFRLSKQEAKSSFGDDRMLLERYVEDPRHIEIQILADEHGNAVYFPERECSIQRRNQKVIEETPSVQISEKTRRAMGEQAVALAKAVGYSSAGTVEFMADADENFFFLEMNTRLQVEHPITEEITGVDLVEHMLRVAAGEKLALKQEDIKINGHAFESRVYAEDPLANYMPSIGRLTTYAEPSLDTGGARETHGEIRVDTAMYDGAEISMYYDPMICKLITWAPTREQARKLQIRALDQYVVRGVQHNASLLRAIYEHERFIAGRTSTNFIGDEWPNQFHGFALSDAHVDELARAVACLAYRDECRASTIDGQSHLLKSFTPGDEQHYTVKVLGTVGPSGMVTKPAQERDLAANALEVAAVERKMTVRGLAPDGVANFEVQEEGASAPLHLSSDDPLRAELFTLRGDAETDAETALQVVKQQDCTYDVQYRGSIVRVKVQTPRIAELNKYMKMPASANTAHLLLSPMPGAVVSISVKEGDEVEPGQELCVVEAMKMQNSLKAMSHGVVKKINVSVGDNLSTDQEILEFEI